MYVLNLAITKMIGHIPSLLHNMVFKLVFMTEKFNHNGQWIKMSLVKIDQSFVTHI
jgi:hypothetical protein